jgi:hypothetical protein
VGWWGSEEAGHSVTTCRGLFRTVQAYGWKRLLHIDNCFDPELFHAQKYLGLDKTFMSYSTPQAGGGPRQGILGVGL